MNDWFHDIIIALGMFSLVFLPGVIVLVQKKQAVERKYRDGIFAVLKVLDMPLAEWEREYRGTMSDSEWFGFQRGYTQAALDSLRFFRHDMKPPLHTNRLEPTPHD